MFCAAAVCPGTWGGNASLEYDLVAGSNVDCQIGTRSLWAKGGCRRQADGTAGLPSAPEIPCAPRQLRLVPEHKVAALQPAARGARREAGSQLRGQA